MPAHDILQDVLIIFTVAVAAVVVLSRLGLPSIAGMIVAGIFIGPGALKLITNTAEINTLAEVGVILVLFGIGLELSLDRLGRLWRPILFGGGIQVTITTVVTAVAAVAFGLSIRSGIFLGFLTAVSSTAIVLRGLEARGEVDAPHGRFTVGILLFQDLCVVPMIMAIPILTATEGSLTPLARALAISALVLVGILVIGRRLVPPLLNLVANTKQRDLFVLSVLLICGGTAYALSLTGLSLAIGAFLGGLVVAGSAFRHQALSDIIPFREVFASLFFVSVGMLFDMAGLLARPFTVLALLAALLLGKAVIVFLVAGLLRQPFIVAMRSALTLAQVGEFSFVLAHAARGTTLLAPDLLANFQAAAIISMIIAPVLLKHGPVLAAAARDLWPFTHLLKMKLPEEAWQLPVAHQDHVIICGYGVTGFELAQALRDQDIPYVIVELNPTSVRTALSVGEPVFYGDATSPQVLEHLGIRHARELVIAVNDPIAAERTVRAARRVAPDVHILVRSRFIADRERLHDAGADEVIPVELMGAVALTARILRRRDVHQDTINVHLDRVRERHARPRPE